jgi:hypothetical protein
MQNGFQVDGVMTDSGEAGTAKVQPTTLQTQGEGRPCWVCGAPKASEEHVWPEWLKDYADRPTGTYWIGVEGDPTATREWTGAAFELTSRVLCEPCNKRFGEKVEGPAAQLIPRMFGGQPKRLDPTEQRLLAQWFYKTALMVATANRVQASALPKPHYLDLSRSYDLPPHSMMWLAHIADPKQEVTLRLQRFNWRDPDITDAPQVEGYGFVASVKDVAAFALIFDTRQSPNSAAHPPLELGAKGVGRLVRIWPPPGHYSVAWPPPTAISYDEVLDLLRTIQRAATPITNL